MEVPESCVELLEGRARSRPDATAYVFLDEHGQQQESLGYAELAGRVAGLAAALAGVAAPGERALILMPPGPDYIVGFLACLYARVIAVPVYPPDPVQLERSLSRLARICENAAPRAVLAVPGTLGARARIAESVPSLASAVWLTADTRGPADARAAARGAAGRDDVAFLQYTSGSTGDPKGVVVSHGNLLANFASIHECLAGRREDVMLSWLPPYHDMGLIGTLLYPLYAGIPSVQMSPITFLKRPLLWPRAISDHRATIGVAPNFAYELCARKARSEDLEGLRLDCWRAVVSGAEPVRPETLRRFAEAFGPCGLRWESHLPVYGLAEATLIVSASALASAPRVISVERSRLASGACARPAPRSEATSDFVGCGRALAHHELRIVDPVSRAPLADGATGEVWFRGPSVAAGYWKRPAESQEIFGATLAGAPEGAPRYLRTGDLGFLLGGELYVVGRIKDVLIVHGRNHYAEDLEATLWNAHPALRPGCAVAGQIGDAVVIAHEVRESETDLEAVVQVIRSRILGSHGIAPSRVALLEPRTLPKTSSGKIRRRASLELLEARQLPGVLRDWQPAATAGGR